MIPLLVPEISQSSFFVTSTDAIKLFCDEHGEEELRVLVVGYCDNSKKFSCQKVVNTEHVPGLNSRNIKWGPIIKLSLTIFGKVKSGREHEVGAYFLA